MFLNADQTLLVAKFKVEVHHAGTIIDPENSEDWHSLALGWALGKGLRPEDARGFAHYIRYETNLG